MNLELANSLAWYGGILAVIIGLIWVIQQMSQKGESPSGQSEYLKYQQKFVSMIWTIFLIPFVAVIITISFLEPHTGARGTMASLLAGIFAPVFLASLQSQMFGKIHKNGRIAISNFASIPLAGIGISLLYAGYVANFYGIRADNLWLAFIIGGALGLFLLRVAAKLLVYPIFETLTCKIEAIFFMVFAAIASVILAGHHFSGTPVKAFFPIFILMGLYIIIIISTIPFSVKPEKSIMDLLPAQLAVFLILFLGISLFLIFTFSIDLNFYFPLLAGAVSSILFIVILEGSYSSIKSADLSSGAMGIFLLLGGIWFSFKWGMGTGMAYYCLGLLSVAVILIPYRSLESRLYSAAENPGIIKNEPDEKTMWSKIFLRSITLTGFAALLLCLFRIFIQKSPLIHMGLDISYADNFLPLLLGVFISLAFEGFNLMGASPFCQGKEGGSGKGIIIYSVSIIASTAVVLSCGIIFRLEGLGAFVLGLSIPALLGVYSYFSNKNDQGLYRASLAPLWIAAAAWADFLVKYRDVPDQLTRLQKEKIVISLIILVIIIYLAVFFKNRREQEKARKIPEEQIEEKDLKAKSVN